MTEVVIVDTHEAGTKKGRRWLWLPLILLIIIAIGISGFVFWALNPFVEIDPIAIAALEDRENITVTEQGWLAFIPHEPPTTGYILYPGARVPATAYAPIAQQIAEEGYLVVIVYPPLNLATLNSNLANPVMEFYSAIEHWVIGGHSLGGSVAANFAQNNPELVDGIVFMASYPANDALRSLDIPVLSIYGTNDGLTTIENIDNSRANLPTDSEFVAIEGGNHAQFGYYGNQTGDNVASISRDAQISQTVNAILGFLETID